MGDKKYESELCSAKVSPANIQKQINNTENEQDVLNNYYFSRNVGNNRTRSSANILCEIPIKSANQTSRSKSITKCDKSMVEVGSKVLNKKHHSTYILGNKPRKEKSVLIKKDSSILLAKKQQSCANRSNSLLNSFFQEKSFNDNKNLNKTYTYVDAEKSSGKTKDKEYIAKANILGRKGSFNTQNNAKCQNNITFTQHLETIKENFHTTSNLTKEGYLNMPKKTRNLHNNSKIYEKNLRKNDSSQVFYNNHDQSDNMNDTTYLNKHNNCSSIVSTNQNNLNATTNANFFSENVYSTVISDPNENPIPRSSVPKQKLKTILEVKQILKEGIQGRKKIGSVNNVSTNASNSYSERFMVKSINNYPIKDIKNPITIL